MADRKFGIETLCLHAGQVPDAVTGSRAAPIPRRARVEAMERLSALPPGRSRAALAERFGVVLPEAAP